MLDIEVLRYKRPLVQRELRICRQCKSGVEDESHFKFKCPNYSQIRKNILGFDIGNGETNDLLKSYLANFEEVSAEKVATFVLEAYELR